MICCSKYYQTCSKLTSPQSIQNDSFLVTAVTTLTIVNKIGNKFNFKNKTEYSERGAAVLPSHFSYCKKFYYTSIPFPFLKNSYLVDCLHISYLRLTMYLLSSFHFIISRWFWSSWANWRYSPTLQTPRGMACTVSLVRGVSLSSWWYLYQT